MGRWVEAGRSTVAHKRDAARRLEARKYRSIIRPEPRYEFRANLAAPATVTVFCFSGKVN
jgi:hypothetical protein